MPALCQGRIVWAEIADKRGHNRYHRPVIILTANEEIASSDILVGVVASNTAYFESPRPTSYIELPYQPQGKVGTKLRKPTVAMCEWIEEFEKAKVLPENIGGLVEPVLLELILDTSALARERKLRSESITDRERTPPTSPPPA